MFRKNLHYYIVISLLLFLSVFFVSSSDATHDGNPSHYHSTYCQTDSGQYGGCGSDPDSCSFTNTRWQCLDPSYVICGTPFNVTCSGTFGSYTCQKQNAQCASYSNFYPSFYPSDYPSFYPDFYPSFYPTFYPSFGSYSSFYPAFYPSFYPTFYPAFVPGVPTIDIVCPVSSIPYNTATNISWTSGNTSACTVSPTGWTGTSNPGISTGNLISTTDYTATCAASDYTVEVFNSGGTFIPPSGVTSVEYLIVAGGGGGGSHGGGGGGGGGVLTGTTAVVPGNSYSVIVGAGGTGGASGGNSVPYPAGLGSNGGNSSFGGIVAIGGGGGGSGDLSNPGSNGGSGGGGGWTTSPLTGTAGGVGTAGQGNNGGNGYRNLGGHQSGGGGGGAGAPGLNAKIGNTPRAGGDGGDGISSAISGASKFYAGGGGGGANQDGPGDLEGLGGLGGGGNGTNGGNNGNPGVANTGGGGGGGSAYNTVGGNRGGGTGGSGVVVVRYRRVESDTCSVVVDPASLTASLTANPSIIPTNGTTNLQTVVSGSAVGTTNYNLWWDCSYVCSDPATCVADTYTACGALPAPAAGACASNAIGYKCEAYNPPYPNPLNHVYGSALSYQPKAIIERSMLTVESSASVTTQAPPTVVSNPATSINTTSATLNGQANPNGATATGWFRYSNVNPGACNDIFGTRAPSSGGTVLGSGTSNVSYFESISGLTAGTTYYLCAIASNVGGTAFGNVISFTTSSIPAVSNTTVTVNNSNYCAVGPHATVSWLYSDPLGSPQAAYEAIINGGSDIDVIPDPAVTGLNPANINPEYRITGTTSTSAGPSSGCNSSNPDIDPQTTCQMTWNSPPGTGTYTAWVRVQNTSGIWSGWTRMGTYINGSNPPSLTDRWSTPVHRLPNSSFTFAPTNPAVGSLISFNAGASVFDPVITLASWSWNYGDGSPSINQLDSVAPFGPFDSSYTYGATGNYTVRFTAEDELNISCSSTNNINLQRRIPRWREVIPR